MATFPAPFYGGIFNFEVPWGHCSVAQLFFMVLNYRCSGTDPSTKPQAPENPLSIGTLQYSLFLRFLASRYSAALHPAG